jgi:HK97 family phage prohead protease
VTIHTHTRDVGTDLTLADDGYAEGIVVPYGEDAQITEQRDGEVIRYTERFVRGAFDRAMRAPDRVTLNYTHDENLGNRLGFGVTFEDRAEGLWGRFKLDRSRLDIARDVLSTSHRGFSISFLSLVPRAWTERAGEVVERRSVHLVHVAAVTTPAYASAGVLALRADGTPADGGEPTEAEQRAAAEAAEAAKAAAELAERRARVLAESDALLARRAEWTAKVGDY